MLWITSIIHLILRYSCSWNRVSKLKPLIFCKLQSLLLKLTFNQFLQLLTRSQKKGFELHYILFLLLCSAFHCTENGQRDGPNTGRWMEKYRVQKAHIWNYQALNGHNIFIYFHFHLCNPITVVMTYHSVIWFFFS